MDNYNEKINENFKSIYGYLNNEYNINLTDDIEECKTENVDYSMNNLPDKMYFGSKNKLSQLEGEKLFLSPYIGISSIFIIDRNNIIIEMMKEQLGEYPKHYTGNIGYKEWDSLSNDELKEPLKFVHMTHNYIDLKGKKTGESKGYIYEIDISNIKDKLKLFVTKNANREVIYTGKEPLIPNRIIPHTIKWSIEFDEDNYNKHGKGIFEKIIDKELDWITNFVESDYFRENTIKSNLQLLSNYKGKLYFISEKEIADVINPQIPDNFFTRNGYEDNETKRVCFSDDIGKCLTGLSQNVKGKIFNVYIPDDISKYKIYKPDSNTVPDVDITNEMWILEPVKLKKVGSIKCISDNGKPGLKFKYGNEEAELYEWDYEWISDDKKENTIFRLKGEKLVRELNREDVTNPYFVRWFFKQKDFQDMEPEQFNFDILIHDGNINFSYGCFIDNKLEGIIRLIKHDGYFELSILYVDSDVFNHGIGQYLLEHTLNKFKNEKIRLNVFEWNKKARYIYEKYGFKIISEYINKSKDDNQYIGDEVYVMERKVDNIVPFSKEYYGDYFKQWLCETDEFRDDNPATLDKYINKFLYTNDNPSYVYLKDNKPEGFISIHGENPIAISMLFVNPEIQGSGIGDKLLTFVIDSFKNRNFILKVFTDNIHAIKLYKKHGFFISDTVTLTKELAGGYDEYIGKQMYTMKRIPKEYTFNEASHGKLKYDFRMGWDYDTGHMIKVVYSLDNIEITDIGDFYYTHKGKKVGATHDSHLDYTRKNIHKKGNVDHQSKGQKVLAIIDTVTNKKLDKVKLINPFAEGICMRSTIQKNIEEIRKKADENPENFIHEIKVGDIDNKATFKSTHWATKVMDKLSGENLRFNKISKSESLKDCRGWKINNINAKDFPVRGELDTKYMTYHNPNKQQALDELYLRGRDVANFLNNMQKYSKNEDEFYNDPKVVKELNNLRIIRNDIETIENGKYSLDIMKKYRDYKEAANSGLTGRQTLNGYTYLDSRRPTEIERIDIDDLLLNIFTEAVITEDQSEEPKPKEKKEEKPKSDKNGVNRKNLYIEFIEFAKAYNQKNSFGSLFDKDIFRVTYPFIPEELRFFYRISNPILCVLENDLTFFQVSELKKINQKNHELTKMIIFAATPTELVVFNRQDKKVYKGLEEMNKIVLKEVLGNTFDLYIQNMIKKGDILNGK